MAVCEADGDTAKDIAKALSAALAEIVLKASPDDKALALSRIDSGARIMRDAVELFYAERKRPPAPDDRMGDDDIPWGSDSEPEDKK
jgi:hypothetical protein